MRQLLTMVTMAVLCGGLVSFGIAEEKTATTSPDSKTAARAAAESAALRADYHRTLAALIEAQSAEKPDQAKVDQLAKKLQQIRAKLLAQNAAAAGNVPAGWGCPWGGPGLGFGRGPGWGGRGRGAGFGPAGGRGFGGGGGFGQGFGPGAGRGLAPGGPAFLDQDNDGICDYYELRHGMHH